jgi:hypothetical protein
MASEGLASIKEGWTYFRLLVLLSIAILFSACNDLRYGLFGQVTDAELRMAVCGNPYIPRDRSIRVEYEFADPDLGTRTENDTLPASWGVPGGQSIRVCYIPGRHGASRVDGNYDGFWLYAICFVSVVAAIVYGIVRFERWEKENEAASKGG